ncbi:MAG: hypothetical protein ISR65_17060 [Bacteriovoracaceae bacterium]|nr:hypothetical protein [Bacteriovoracaceae bacterium]
MKRLVIPALMCLILFVFSFSSYANPNDPNHVFKDPKPCDDAFAKITKVQIVTPNGTVTPNTMHGAKIHANPNNKIKVSYAVGNPGTRNKDNWISVSKATHPKKGYKRSQWEWANDPTGTVEFNMGNTAVPYATSKTGTLYEARLYLMWSRFYRKPYQNKGFTVCDTKRFKLIK